MSLDRFTFQAAVRDFQRAHLQASLRDVLARLTRTPNELLSYEEVARSLRLSSRTERGIESIPVEAIVGSVGRYADFTRTFLPRRAADQERWARVRKALLDPSSKELPPIQVYKVGEAYFVLDGNHRVSVARREGIKFIDAYVTEIQTQVPLTPDVSPDDLILKAEYAEFLETTGLAVQQSGFDLTLSAPGQYHKLLEQIAVHQYLVSRAQGRDVALNEAAADWLATAYAPLTLEMRERGLLRWFPNRTEADLYVWVSEHRRALEQELGWEVRPEAAVTDLAVRSNPRARNAETAPGSWRRDRLSDRYLEHLFQDLLVPLGSAPESWNALEQALLVAAREGAAVHGLHVIRSARERTSPRVQELQARFAECCAAANVPGTLTIESGDVARKIAERAVFSDLIVLHVAHPPARGLSPQSSRFRAIMRNAGRPVLAVPRAPTQLARALLAFDGSPKAKEALFAAAYLAENWKTAVTVVTLRHGTHESSGALDYARAYLELHELQAEYVLAEGTAEVLLEIAAERDRDCLLMGSYNVSTLRELRRPSAVSALLRTSAHPLLICQ